MNNKFFLVFIIVAAIVVVGLVAWTGRQNTTNQAVVNASVNAKSNVTTETSKTTNSTTNVNTPVTTNPTAGYSILASAETTIVGEITTYIFADNNILNVMPMAMQSAILNETPVKERTTITVGGLTGERLIISSAKDGSDIAIVQISKGDQLFDFRGDDSYLSKLGQYIEFTN